MKVKVTYDDARVEVFSTKELTDGKALEGMNLLTNYAIRLDEISERKLWLELYWYRAGDELRKGYTDTLPPAERMMGWRFNLVDADEIDHVEEIFLDNVLVAWREGAQLVFGSLFNKQERLYYSDTSHASISRKAVFLRDYLARKHPELADDPAALAAMIGYPPEAFAEMARAELREIRKQERGKEAPQ